MIYLTFRDLRLKLGGRSRSAVYGDVVAGRLPPPIKLGGKLYWPEEVVEAWLGEGLEDVAAPARGASTTIAAYRNISRENKGGRG
jgi:predicted DNA-binding transcriptional regulator AlpA